MRMGGELVMRETIIRGKLVMRTATIIGYYYEWQLMREASNER